MDSYPPLQDIPIQMPILLDGGIGTGLTEYGYKGDTPVVKFAVENPDAVIALQQGYLDSGAKIIRTATFGANSAILSRFGLQKETAFLNEQAARITYDAFHEKAIIAGCISTSGLYIEPYGESTFTELMSVYREQVKALSPYCDMFSIENVPAIWNMRAAVLACKKENKPIMVTMCVDEDGDTDVGTNVLSTLIILQELGISAFGISSTAADITAELIRKISPYAKIPLIAKPSAEYVDEDGNKHRLSPKEFADNLRLCIENGAIIIGGSNYSDNVCQQAIADMLSEEEYTMPEIEKQDMSLAFADENQIFFLEPDTTEFSPAIECAPDMSEEISDMCEESYDILTVAINSPDDAIDFAKNMHMSTLPVAFLSDDEISLKMALMLYQGRAIVDGKSLIEEEKLQEIAQKYGAVVY
ncbi:MAG: homocysteine S-methyltransferase family protein [Ruminococcaceae bacterium]|nr:homocysteine S-methyltransferase family protein [Oscillospiraceae bacterium]